MYVFWEISKALTPGIGVVGMASDKILENINKSWKPNHFVNKNLKPFLSKK